MAVSFMGFRFGDFKLFGEMHSYESLLQHDTFGLVFQYININNDILFSPVHKYFFAKITNNSACAQNWLI